MAAPSVPSPRRDTKMKSGWRDAHASASFWYAIRSEAGVALPGFRYQATKPGRPISAARTARSQSLARVARLRADHFAEVSFERVPIGPP
jgi:hypothetical protein